MSRQSRGRLRKVAIIAEVAVLTLLLVAAAVITLANHSFSSSGRIARNVEIAGVEVENLSLSEAVEALHRHWVPTLPKEITVKYPHGQVETSPENLGVQLMLEDAVKQALQVGREGNLLSKLVSRIRLWRESVEVEVETYVVEDRLRRALVELAEKINRKPRNARVNVVGEEVEVIPGETGRTLNVDASVEKLRQVLADPKVASIELEAETVEPAVTARDLEHIEVVLGAYSTPYNASRRDRTHNLKLAADILNETVVMPGAKFSLNEVIGPRLTERGYRDADIFIEGEVRPSTGGGVCQVASTTYNAALLANLDVIERHHHSRPVDYAPTGRDATVYWGQYDLKFVNSLGQAILILAQLADSHLHVKILGSREDDCDVEVYRKGPTRIAHEHKEVPDPELEVGKNEIEKEGRDGWRVTVYRRVERNGELVREQRLHTDYYRPQTGIMRIGAKPVEEELPAAELRPGAERPPEDAVSPPIPEPTPQAAEP